jgi:hypothetical protein
MTARHKHERRTFPTDTPNTKRVVKRPEDELLRLCVRHRLVPADRADIRHLIEHGIDWPYLFNLAAAHHVLKRRK